MDRTPKVLQAAARDAAARARLLAEALDVLADAADTLAEVPQPTPAAGYAVPLVETPAPGNDVAVGASERLWTVADVANFLGASESWVRHASASGRLPRIRIGGLLRFHPDQIRAHTRGEESLGEGARVLPRRPRKPRK